MCFRHVFLGLPSLVRSLRFVASFRNSHHSLRFVSSLGTQKQCKIGFIGLGNMGSEMCKNLLDKEYDVIVKDLDTEREKKMVSKGAKVAANYREMASVADVLITMLPASQHLLHVYNDDEGLIKHLKPGKIAIDCSTVDHGTSKQLGESLANINVSFIDAPVSGGILAASNGTLSFMVGGEKETLQKVEHILMSMGSKIFHCGSLGNGQIAKMCNNLLLAVSTIGVAEVFHLGACFGVDPKVLTTVINHSSGRCWLTDTYHPVPNIFENVPSSNQYKPGFTSQMMIKDLEISKKASAEVKCSLNMGEKAFEIYKEICKSNLKDKDFTIAYEYIKNKNK